MATNNEPTQTAQIPRLVPMLSAGFNLVANHIYLILFPIALDFFFWFGPHLKIQKLAQPFLQLMQQQMDTFPRLGGDISFQTAQNLLADFFASFNVFSFLRTYPVGIGSLLSPMPNNQNPLGTSVSFEIENSLVLLLVIAGIYLIGIFLGSLYFREVARLAGKGLIAHHMRPLLWQYLQSLILLILFMVIIALIFIPFILLLSFVTILSPAIGQILLFLGSLFVIWMVIPLFFSTHGIFLNQQTAFRSMMTSINLIRFHLPGTGMFILMIILLNEGLNVIWRIAPLTSWMSLLGIIGHAFVSTAVLVATYLYYRNGLIWMHAQVQLLQKQRNDQAGRKF